MRLLSLLLFFLWMAFVSTALAQQSGGNYPQYTSTTINDFNNTITADTEAKIEPILAELRDNFGIEMTVITIASYRDYDTDDPTFERFATNLFNDWGIGDSDLDGVMLLVATQDRKVRIEVGTGYENTLNDDMQQVIDSYILPRFRENDYDAGIYHGVRAIAGVLKGDSGIPDTSPNNNSSFTLVTTDPYSDQTSVQWGNVGMVAGAGAVGAGGLFAALRRYNRTRPRQCPHCQAQMIRLDEITDDEFLDEGQRQEEGVESVDYDVWKCDSCGTHQVFAYGAMFSRFGECPSCHYRTMWTHSRVIDSADCYASGLREVTKECRNCTYRDTYQETIPRRNCSDNSSSGSSSSSSSSSRSSSFSGGRSSGGGASGSW